MAAKLMLKTITRSAGSIACLLIVASPTLASMEQDNQIARSLLGIWKIADDSVDKAGAPPLDEVFRADGTYTVRVFKDAKCSEIVNGTTGKWKINDGILYSTLNNGRVLRDTVVSIDKLHLTFFSLDEGRALKRVHEPFCLVGPTT